MEQSNGSRASPVQRIGVAARGAHREPLLDALVQVDPGHIEQVVMNLAVNARDAMPNGGTPVIAIGHREIYQSQPGRLGVDPGSYVQLSISDDGDGMAEDIRAQIFDPFFTTKDQGKGTGLGLATVYGIVKQSGGHIWVDSQLGHGTTFEICLPVAVAATPPSPTPLARQRSAGQECILVVEDEGPLRSLVATALLERGFDVVGYLSRSIESVAPLMAAR